MTVKPLCPSAGAAIGAKLIGRMQADGTIGMAFTPMTIGAAFLETARQHGDPEKDFRFASPCIKSSCKHWNGRCGIATQVAAAAPSAADELRDCGIRADCRWFAQEGAAACVVCPTVHRLITEVRPDS